MSDKMRWRFGDTNPVVAAVDAETVIEIGDLVYHDLDDAKPASALPVRPADSAMPREGADIRSSELAQQFVERFLGVAMARSRKDQTDPIRVGTTGVFEFDCPRGTFELGDLIGPTSAGGDGLLNQYVASVGASKYAIGRVAKRIAAPSLAVLVDIRSTIIS